MKSVLIIGIGRLGGHLAERMRYLGNDVTLLDINPQRINKYRARFPKASSCDYSSEEVLRCLDIPSFDICFVTIGSDFEASMICTSLLKKLGAKYVAARARDEIQFDLLTKIGADEIIYSDGEIADRLAVRHNSDKVLDYIGLTDGFAIFELPVNPDWVGKTIEEIGVRRQFKINVIAVKSGEALNPDPMPDYKFKAGDIIWVIGKSNDIYKIP